MSELVLTTLISTSAGLLGAFIGFAGSFLTSKRTAEQARQQRRVERVQEMQAEVVPRLVVQAEESVDKWAALVRSSLQAAAAHPIRTRGAITSEEFRDVMADFNLRLRKASEKQSGELYRDLRLQGIWLPDDLATQIGNFYLEISNRFVAAAADDVLSETTTELLEKGELEGSLTEQEWDDFVKAFTDDMTKPARDWLEGEGNQQKWAIWETARKHLGVVENGAR